MGGCMRFAKRMDTFHASVFTELKEKKEEFTKRTGQKTIDLSIGSPQILPDSSIMQVMREAVSQPENYKYAINELDDLLLAIQNWYKKRYQVDLDKEEIICLQGSQEALCNLPMVLCDPGDVVLVPDPHYPIFVDGPHLAGAEVAFMPMKEENDYLIQFNEIDPELARRAKMMIVSYPNNPTCATAPDFFYEELIAFAKKYDILVIHDNAYSELVFDGKEGKSFLSFPGAKEIGVEVNSFSKTYGMAGARLGVCVGNKDVIQHFRILKSNIDYGIFLPVQYAGIEALCHGGSTIEETRAMYQAHRDILVGGLNRLGWKIKSSPATMFVWAKIPDSYSDSNAFVLDVLEKTGVVLTPGQSFGQAGIRYVRMALVQDGPTLQEAVNRFEKAHCF